VIVGAQVKKAEGMIDLDKLLGLEEVHGAARLRHVGFIERVVDAAIHLINIKNYINFCNRNKVIFCYG